MNLGLQNKNALVCGSTQGIGKASALVLAKEGANVTLVARNEKKLQVVLKELAVTGSQKHRYIVADFSNPKELQAKIMASSLNFHVLINNTGGPAGGPIFKAKVDAFEMAFTMHLKCNHILTQAVVPFMKQEEYGRIINIISTSVKQPLDGLGVSNTIRGAVASWAKTLANELGGFGITVNNVLPGFTDTERLHSIIKSKSEKMNVPVDEVIATMKNSTPAKRFAQPEETADTVAFLASERASYINGINVPVDGGRTKSL